METIRNMLDKIVLLLWNNKMQNVNNLSVEIFVMLLDTWFVLSLNEKIK